MMLHRFQDRGEPVVVTLQMSARTLPDAPSRNVVAEIVGREKPDEVVVLGGHIDSWDVGQGAMDDGGGSVAAWEAVRLIQRLGLRPRRTVRVVLWTNEENGGSGGTGLPRRARGRAGQARAGDGVGQRRRSTRRGTSWRARTRPPRWCSRWPACSSRSTRRASSGWTGARRPTSRRWPRRAWPRWSSTSRGRATSGITTARATRWTSSIPAELARCVAAMAVMAYVVADLPDALPHSATN